MLATATAFAQGAFLETGNSRLREDLMLLADEGVISLPLNEWPLARQDVVAALDGVDEHELQEPALRLAFQRVRGSTSLAPDAATWKLREVGLTAGQPGLLRHYGTLARENGELRSVGGVTTQRYDITLAATGVVDASDGQDIRFDGSNISIRLGNWLFSANQIERWWGPGRDGSLILSNNARPMPAIAIDRVRSAPLDLPVLRWLGPWRFNAFLGLMENERSDVDQPAFMGMRLSFKPARIFEFGMSRSAQFCGKGRDCDAGTFGRLLIGRDNVGLRGLEDPDKEPGNQMAGFDVRIVSPFKAIPLAVYAQEIGEDNSSTGIPERYLAIFGSELWFLLRTGSVLRTHVEYANTKVKWYDGQTEPDIAYRQAIFFAGYRFRGRNIGHTTDADSESTSIGLALTTGRGDRWAAHLRRGRLDRLGAPDPYNPVTFGPSDYESVELSWARDIADHGFGVQVGYENQTGRGSDMFGFVEWRKKFR